MQNYQFRRYFIVSIILYSLSQEIGLILSFLMNPASQIHASEPTAPPQIAFATELQSLSEEQLPSRTPENDIVSHKTVQNRIRYFNNCHFLV